MALSNSTKSNAVEQRPIKLAHLFFTALATIVSVIGVVLAITEAQRNAHEDQIDQQLIIHERNFDRRINDIQRRLDRMDSRYRPVVPYDPSSSGRP